MPLSIRRLPIYVCLMLAAADAAGSVDVAGAPRAVSTVIEAYMAEQRLSCPADDGGTKVLAAARDALDALGFFGATVSLEACTLRVDAGARARIESWQLRFSGAAAQEDAPLLRARRLLPEAGGEFDPQVYSTLKQKVLTVLTDAGYLDAEFATAVVDVDVERNVASVDWQVKPGERLVIDPIIIEQDFLSRRLMRRFLTFEKGDYLQNDELLESYDNLVGSDYFANVRVSPEPDARDGNRVPVRVTAKAAEKWSYLAGPGFATDTGPRLRAEANARYLSKSGNRLSFSSLVAPVAGNVKAEYRWPYGNPNHEWYAIETRYGYEDTDTARSTTAAIGLRRTARLSRRWTQTWYTDYSEETFDISAQEGRSQLLLFGTNLTYTSTIDAARPRWGQRLSVDVRGGSRALVSDNDVAQLRISAKQILPFLGRSRLLLRGEAGYSWQEDFSDLPASLRFFTGGDKTVRGYALESLGAVDATGRVIGGDRLYVGSVEFDMPVRDNWSLALFTDAGSAFRDSPNFSQSVGIGLRWYSPIGPIRMDLAHPMQDSDQAVRLHISLGPDI